jgi:hypothetical protein
MYIEARAWKILTDSSSEVKVASIRFNICIPHISLRCLRSIAALLLTSNGTDIDKGVSAICLYSRIRSMQAFETVRLTSNQPSVEPLGL